METGKMNLQATIGHLGIEVSSLEKSRKFYNVLLTQLDSHLIYDSEHALGYANQNFQVWLSESYPTRIRREAPTGEEDMVADHLAILVSNPETVNAIAIAMMESGFTPLFPPEEHPQFTSGYYAASFCDPDNYVIEIYTIQQNT
jgi:catechol 2,3-dioxygenase-like lactoylglutathione lyase family enzyme